MGGPPLSLPEEEEEYFEPASVSGEFELPSLEGECGTESGAPPGEPPALPAGPGNAEAGIGDGWTRLGASAPPGGAERSVPSCRDTLEFMTSRTRPRSNPQLDLAADMTERFALGDCTGALRLAELVLGRDPEHRDAQRIARTCRERLIEVYASRLSAASGRTRSALFGSIPQLAVAPHEVRWLGLDHRQAFLLSRIDGRSTIEDLLDLSGMSRLEVMKMLVELLEAGAIRFAEEENRG